MKNHTAKLIPLLRRDAAPGAALATGLMSSLALAAPGDLDPTFGDMGRLGPILNGPAWTIKDLDDGTTLVAGGDLEPVCDSGWYCYYYYSTGYEATNFVNLVADSGMLDPSFDMPLVANTQVFDIVRQPDGRVIAAGRKVSRSPEASQLTVFRLQADGSLDPAFGEDGIFALPTSDHGVNQSGTSIVLDPDGRIVVAGSKDDKLIVLRLLPNGSLDSSFGTSGIFAGPETHDDAGARTTILRTTAGNYRVTISNAAGCQVVALNAAGTPDNTFGNAGVATVVATAGSLASCSSIVSQADGRLLVAGSAARRGFAMRLLATGQADASFSANEVSAATHDATALAVGNDGSVIVAGTAANGTSILRLQSDGTPDALFGNAGSTLIDLPSERGITTSVHDLLVRPDGSVVGAGGTDLSNQAFVVRLLGASGGNSPGVLGIAQQSTIPTEEGAGEVVVQVRRSGGDAGSVSVAYKTVVGDSNSALAGKDYTATAGRLTWDDGDRHDQEIRVPILADGTGEEPEYFRVMLTDAQGGPGLGTRTATVAIAADGGPYGQFAIDRDGPATEGNSTQVYVHRHYYSTGAVSVTVTPIAGSATAGEDFAPQAATVSWADGETDIKIVDIAIRDDSVPERTESFTVELSNPTGGAVIGPHASTTIRIAASDQPPAESSGGGAFEYLSLLLLGVTKMLQSMRAAFRSRSPRRFFVE